jgi:hypothetical protein
LRDNELKAQNRPSVKYPTQRFKTNINPGYNACTTSVRIFLNKSPLCFPAIFSHKKKVSFLIPAAWTTILSVKRNENDAKALAQKSLCSTPWSLQEGPGEKNKQETS